MPGADNQLMDRHTLHSAQSMLETVLQLFSQKMTGAELLRLSAALSTLGRLRDAEDV